MNTTSTGLQYLDAVVGEGDEAKAGQYVSVHYTGWLYQDGEQGAKFDSSRDRNDPFAFPLGAGMVIKGWDEGVQGMKVGGQRSLIIPPELGYGPRGAGGVIPPNATLKFDVELLAVELPPLSRSIDHRPKAGPAPRFLLHAKIFTSPLLKQGQTPPASLNR
jgi:FKBP-type peptidyl-prolyl cis-trans isomerase FkpA